MKPVAKRNYNMSDGDLIQKSDDLINSARRDLTELTPFGITNASLDFIESKRTAFSEYPTDQELCGAMKLATLERNNRRRDLMRGIQEIILRVEKKYGKNSAQITMYDASDTSKLRGSELLQCAGRVIRLATEDVVNLASEGLTLAIITALTTKKTTFDIAIDNQHSAVKLRDISVNQRIDLGNDLYAALVSLADLGKGVFSEINEAIYNDYIIYVSENHEQVVDGNIGAGDIINVSVTGLNENDVITIENTGGATLTAYFAEEPTDEPTAQAITIAAGESQVVSINDIGYNEISAPRFNIKNTGSSGGSYVVRV